uniref:Histone-lysine N-methyltransferase n=1 Tax=Chlamydomonas leiostraca TaxID=1034604 RepID=A0A7S0S5E0_9CHLO|mmetsp:Transcript_9592/g.23760  ORF Transcript_9592/g.23760 Transcript_9592/m.23760 type:complete len:1831 (+) Transcript_9592:131-5623(+)|eukprot:CAMPEP_0202858068 /NCGR_PEP_ID=MMETSP1391-20130828/750_1 /ASSEMBLY_ACC=CAM_ASM_000867 /TAXON_ID=1034604 /ORGANISM="Chlamydomonas leiostraca, Strain SAG 11-49" /LENGTH=1830 /DNA_ID=CAMNT_0049536941 /DNA_START=38 /DNA_END=5530 /DNA_ORIENTATION=-
MEDSQAIQKALANPKLLEDAQACQVVWARVKGYPFWPAQVLNDAAASKKLGKVAHKRNFDVPVMFFGTLEIAWIAQADIVGFREGIQQGLLAKGKHKSFLRACSQVHEFLVIDKKRKAPQYWWCRAPSNGLDNDDEDSKPASKQGTPGSKARGRAAAQSSEDESEDEESSSEGEEVQAEEKRSKPAPKPRSRPVKRKADGPKRAPKRPAPAAAASSESGSGSGSGSDDSSDDEVSGSREEGNEQEGSGSGDESGSGSSSEEEEEEEQEAEPAAEVKPRSKPPSNPAPKRPPPASRSSSQPVQKPPAAAKRSSSTGGPPDSKEAAKDRPPIPAGLPPKKKLKVAAEQEAAAAAAAAAASAASAPSNSHHPPASDGAQASGCMGAAIPAVKEVDAMAYDDDILKLPAEIRRLAGIKLVKKPPPSAGGGGGHGGGGGGHGGAGAGGHGGAGAGAGDASASAQAASSSRPRPAPVAVPKQEQAADSPKRTEGEQAGPGATPRDADSQHEDSPSRRETRSGITPRPGPSKLGDKDKDKEEDKDKEDSKKDKKEKKEKEKEKEKEEKKDKKEKEKDAKDRRKLLAAPGAILQRVQPRAAEATAPAAASKAAVPATAAASAVPAAAVVAVGPSGSAAQPATSGEPEKERQRRMDRELQLQRKRERERERRQQLKLQRQREREQQGAGSSSSDEEVGEGERKEEGPGAGPKSTEGKPQEEGEAAPAELRSDVKLEAGGSGQLEGDKGVVMVGPDGKPPAAAKEAKKDSEQGEARARDRGVVAVAGIMPVATAAVAVGISPKASPAVVTMVMPSVAPAAVPLLKATGEVSDDGGAGDAARKPPRPQAPGAVRIKNRENKALGKAILQRNNNKDRSRAAATDSLLARAVPAVSTVGVRKMPIPPVLTAVPTVNHSRVAAIPPVLAAAVRPAHTNKRSSDGVPAISEGNQTASADDGTRSGDAQAGGDFEMMDAEAAEALQFMQSMAGDGGMGGTSAPLLTVPEVLLPPDLSLKPIDSLELAMAAAPLPTAQAAFVVPRMPRAEIAGFRWPEQDLLLPPVAESFSLPKAWLLARPPKFDELRRNQWVSQPKPKRLPEDEVQHCMCRPSYVMAEDGTHQLQFPNQWGCGADCLNRSSMVCCDPKSCNYGQACSNMPFHMQQQPKMEMFLTENRGYGVRVNQRVRSGQFLVEYVGEVIDERELAVRMEAAKAAGEPCYYIMELAPGLYIDARFKGSLARLLNSSCQPNCETQKWTDAATNEPRVGIFAKRDIEPGEELTYDYFFQHYGNQEVNPAAFKCMCGAPNCRGTMDVNPEKRKDLGRRVEVYWDEDGMFYVGTVVGYIAARRTHIIMYDDGDKERLCLDDVPHRWLDEGMGQPGSGAFDQLAALQPLLTLQSAPEPAPRRRQMGSYVVEDEGSPTGDEEEAYGSGYGRRSSQDDGTGPGTSGRSIMGGEGAYGALPPKKRQRLMAAGGSGSMLPPLRAPDSDYTSDKGMGRAGSGQQGSGRGRDRERSNSTGAGRGGAADFFGGDMASLLQAVESELGDGGEAAAAAAQAAAEHLEQRPQPESHGWEPEPRGSRGYQHQYQANGHMQSPRGRHMQAIRSPARRSNHHQGPWGPPPPHGYPPPHPHMMPGPHMQQGYGPMGPGPMGPPYGPPPPHANGWGHPPPPHLPPQQGMYMRGQGPPGAHHFPPPPPPHEFTQVNVIEDVLGIKISAFNVPLFQVPINGHRQPRMPVAGMPPMNGPMHAAHLQRMPITTAPPGSGGPLPPLSGAPSDPRRGGLDALGLPHPGKPASAFQAALMGSQLLNSLPGMGNLPPLPSGLSLFKGPAGPPPGAPLVGGMSA